MIAGSLNPIMLGDIVVNAINYVRFSVLDRMIETANGSGWDYTATGAGNQMDANTSNYRLPANTDGDFQCGYSITTTQNYADYLFICLNSTNNVGLQSGCTYGIYAEPFNFSPSRKYNVLTNGNSSASNVATKTYSAGDLVRLRRSGTTVYAEVKATTDTDFVVIHTFSGSSTAQLFPGVVCYYSTFASKAIMPIISSSALPV